MNSKFEPGQKVIVGGDIEGVIEEVILLRNAKNHIYKVEWWHEGLVQSRVFHEEELK